MEARSVNFNFHARYFILGTPGTNIKHVWFVCHGYGQLAQYFIRKFKILDDGHHLIVAPEGLSHFYLEGFSGKVGASWMTKEDRETDIINYCTYLGTLGTTVLQQLDEKVKVTLLGFSQGAATASRWLAATDINIDRFILWAGVLPKDLDIVTAKEKLTKTKNYVIYGKSDPFLTPEVLEEQTSFYDQSAIRPEIITFDGGHEINEAILKGLRE